MRHRYAPRLSVLGFCALVGCVGSSPGASATTDAGMRDAALPHERDVGPALHDIGPAVRVDASEPDVGVPSSEGTPGALARTSVLAPSILVTADGLHAVVGDVDGSRLHVVDLDVVFLTDAAPIVVRLPDGALPWRLLEDGRGRIHAVLRGTGQIATMLVGDTTATIRDVCATPRGIAWRERDDALLVACAEGDLVTLGAASGEATSRVHVADDLRDVVVLGERVFVSTFHRPEILEVDTTGHVVTRWAAPGAVTANPLTADPHVPPTGTQTLAPRVALRMVELSGALWMLYRLEREDPIPANAPPPPPPPSGDVIYVPGAGPSISPCATVLQTGLARLDPATGALDAYVMPVLFATDLSTRAETGLLGVTTGVGLTARVTPSALAPGLGCDDQLHAFDVPSSGDVAALGRGGAPISVSRSPLRVSNGSRDELVLDGRFEDFGSRMFRDMTPSGLACSMCHPEGGDDGHVWHLLPSVPLRTQSVWGGVLSTAPLHWEGDLGSVDSLLESVWRGRMQAAALDAMQNDAFAAWFEGLAPPRAPDVPADAAARGRALFESPSVGCATCHAGEHHTDGLTLDVGTGGLFQVPQLRGLAFRAPLMHDGCAASLRERFTGSALCTGGDQHGAISALSSAEIDDLVAYLRTL